MITQDYLKTISESNKPFIIYKSNKGFDLYTNFSKKIILTNKNIHSFINKISNINIDYIPTSGIGIVDFNCSWKSINNNGILFDFIYPKKLNQI